MKTLVTGGNGFVGSHFAEELARRGHDVYCLVRETSDLTWLKGLPVRLAFGDVTCEGSLYEAVAGKDYVYHVAGVVKAKSQWAFDRVNAGGTARLLKACGNYNETLKRFVLVSSQSAGGPSRTKSPVCEEDESRPVSRYGMSKLKAEEKTKGYMGRLPVTIVRPPAIYGPRDRGMLPFFRMLKKGVVVLVGGERFANFVYVKDMVAGTIAAAENEKAIGQIYYIAGERGYAWREFAETAARVSGKKVRLFAVPAVTVRLVGGVNSVVASVTGRARMLDWQKAREILEPFWLCDIGKAQRDIGYCPRYTLEEGVQETIRWYEKEKWI